MRKRTIFNSALIILIVFAICIVAESATYTPLRAVDSSGQGLKMRSGDTYDTVTTIDLEVTEDATFSGGMVLDDGTCTVTDGTGVITQTRTTSDTTGYTNDIITEWTPSVDYEASGGSNGIYAISNAIYDLTNAYALRGRMDLRDAADTVTVNQLHAIDALINLNETVDYTVGDNIAVIGAAVHGGTSSDVISGYLGGAKPAATLNLFYGVWGPTAEQNLDVITNGVLIVSHEQTTVDYGYSFFNSGAATAGIYLLNHPTYEPATMTAGILMEGVTDCMSYGIDMNATSATVADIRLQDGSVIDAYSTVPTFETVTGVAVENNAAYTVHRSVFTFTNYAMTVVDSGSDGGHGSELLMTFPEGHIQILSGHQAFTAMISDATNIDTDAIFDWAVGSAKVDSDANDVLAGTEQDITTKEDGTLSAGTLTFDTLNSTLFALDGSDTAITAYLNVAVTEADMGDTDTMYCTGTVSINWFYMGDD